MIPKYINVYQRPGDAKIGLVLRRAPESTGFYDDMLVRASFGWVDIRNNKYVKELPCVGNWSVTSCWQCCGQVVKRSRRV